jgi:glycine/D-amino acid oxidase-like deaminating enzyme
MPGEILVVGGGLIGSSIAWRLARKGAQVTIADAGNLGGEASPAGAGMLSPGAEFDKPSVWLDLGFESLRLYPSFVEELQAETGIDTDFRMFYPDDGIVDPAALLRALHCACESRQVQIMRERVTTVEPRDYAAVVIAAGAWSGQVHVKNVTLPAVTPIKGHLIGFQMEPGALGAVRRQGETYVLQRSNGFLIAGSNEQDVGFDRTVDAAICQDIHRRAARLFAPLEHTAPVKRWIGFRPRLAHWNATGDGPLIGRVEGTNVWLAYGHYRNGILLTPVTAQRVAEQVAAEV